ncbi:MAG: hypothetical protein P0S96_02205 [Simkaniaceae bacterium]|nr:hypothetical protein [Candidatus Sacchlamyda saccharinae]
MPGIFLSTIHKESNEKLFVQTSNKKIKIALLASLLLFFLLPMIFGSGKMPKTNHYLPVTFIEEKDTSEQLGLVRTKKLLERTAKEQAYLYSKAQKNLTIISISGKRITSGILDGGSNVIKKSLLELMKNKDVKIRLIIYDPAVSNLNLTREDVGKIAQSVEDAKEIQRDYPSNFECRMIDFIAPFHGDLIDENEAHIVPLPLGGINRPISDLFIESYERRPPIQKNKLDTIAHDFETMWKRGIKI